MVTREQKAHRFPVQKAFLDKASDVIVCRRFAKQQTRNRYLNPPVVKVETSNQHNVMGKVKCNGGAATFIGLLSGEFPRERNQSRPPLLYLNEYPLFICFGLAFAGLKVNLYSSCGDFVSLSTSRLSLNTSRVSFNTSGLSLNTSRFFSQYTTSFHNTPLFLSRVQAHVHINTHLLIYIKAEYEYMKVRIYENHMLRLSNFEANSLKVKREE